MGSVPFRSVPYRVNLRQYAMGELKSFIVINPLKRKMVGFLCTGILNRRLLFVSVVDGVETKLLSGRCDKILWMGIKVSLLL